MSSAIDTTQPPEGAATTAAVRANFTAAKDEIESLQAGGGREFALCTPPGSTLFFPFNPNAMLSTYINANANYLYLVPFRLQADFTISSLGIHTASGTPGSVNVAIYDNVQTVDSDIAAYKIADSGPLDCSSAGFISTSISPLILRAFQIYYMAFSSDVALDVYRQGALGGNSPLVSFTFAGYRLTYLMTPSAYPPPGDISSLTFSAIDGGPPQLFTLL